MYVFITILDKYIFICYTIAGSLSEQDGEIDQEVVIAALLHDVIEETFVSKESLLGIFGPRVTRLIEIQSEEKTTLGT